MMKFLALSAVMAACAMPAFAQADRPDLECGLSEPETTGSLASDPRSLNLPAGKFGASSSNAADEPWQEQADEDAERHRERLIMCGVD